jgi:hypothetical protein
MEASRTVVAAPISFARSLGRMTNLLWLGRPVALKVIVVAAVPSILFVWWSAIVVW